MIWTEFLKSTCKPKKVQKNPTCKPIKPDHPPAKPGQSTRPPEPINGRLANGLSVNLFSTDGQRISPKPYQPDLNPPLVCAWWFASHEHKVNLSNIEKDFPSKLGLSSRNRLNEKLLGRRVERHNHFWPNSLLFKLADKVVILMWKGSRNMGPLQHRKLLFHNFFFNFSFKKPPRWDIIIK